MQSISPELWFADSTYMKFTMEGTISFLSGTGAARWKGFVNFLGANNLKLIAKTLKMFQKDKKTFKYSQRAGLQLPLNFL